MREPAAILFDLDGTLLDTLPDIAASANALRAGLGLDAASDARVRSWIGEGLGELLARAVADAGEAVDRDEAVRRYRAHYGTNLAVRTEPYPRVDAGLRALAARGFALGVVSNKPERFTRPLVEHFGWAGLLPVVLGGDSAAERKPHPAPLLLAAERLGVAPERCWMLGDSPGDLVSADAAGFAGRVGACWGYRSLDELEKAPKTALAGDFGAFLALLQEAG